MKERLQKVGENLMRERGKAGLKQDTLAEMLDCTVITLSRWENGHNAMKANDIIRVVELLGISADELLGVRNSTITDEDLENMDLCGMVKGLDVVNRRIVEKTVRAMVRAMRER